MSRKMKAGVVAGMLLTGAALSVWAADMSLDQIPEKAKAALLKLAGDNKITEVGAEKEHGVLVYEAAWKADGAKVEVEVTADGDMLEMETVVAEKDVPAAVKDAATKALAGADKIRYEKHTYVVYEVEGKVSGKKKEMTICPTGKIKGHEDEGDDDDDEGEDDDEK